MLKNELSGPDMPSLKFLTKNHTYFAIPVAAPSLYNQLFELIVYR
jgi:hypothetical protein